MRLIDVNILLFAYRKEANRHAEYKAWLQQALESEEGIGWSDLVLAAVVRILSHRKIYCEPTPLADALAYAEFLREHTHFGPVLAGPRHWQIFAQLCRDADVHGSMVSDAYFAALAIETNAEWITADRDYARFPGLRWRHPLDQRK